MTAPVDDAAVERSLDALDTFAAALISVHPVDSDYCPVPGRGRDLADGIGDALTSDDARTAWFLMLSMCPYHRIPIGDCTPVDDDEDPLCRAYRGGAPTPMDTP